MDMLFPLSQPYSDGSLASALQLAENLEADLGGTEILPPLNHLFNQRSIESRKTQIFVLTDGAVSNSMECVRTVGKLCNGTTRLFTVGVGPSVDRHLVKGLARAGGGTAVFTSRGEGMASKVLEQLQQALAPAFHLVDVDWGLEEGSVDKYMTYKTPQVVHQGARLTLYRLFPKGAKVGKVTITASNRQKMVIEGSEEVLGELVHKMLARKMIQELEEEDAGEEEKFRREELIKEVALKYKLTSRFTSFVAVDLVRQQDLAELRVRQVRNLNICSRESKVNICW